MVVDPSFRWLSIFFSFLFSRSVQHITFITWWQDSDSNRFFSAFTVSSVSWKFHQFPTHQAWRSATRSTVDSSATAPSPELGSCRRGSGTSSQLPRTRSSVLPKLFLPIRVQTKSMSEWWVLLRCSLCVSNSNRLIKRVKWSNHSSCNFCSFLTFSLNAFRFFFFCSDFWFR